MPTETAPRPAAIQAGMSNDDLLAAWTRKLPSRAPQGQELSAFALGVEVGAERYAETWDALQFAVKNYQDMSSKKDRATATVYQFHYAMKDAGWHPGRTDDNLCDVIRAKGKELQELRGALEALIDVWDDGREPPEVRAYVQGTFAHVIEDARKAVANSKPAND